MTHSTPQPRVIAPTVTALARSAADRLPGNVAARFKRDGAWVDMTYAEAVEAIEEMALGLIALGIEPGDRVCILSDTRVQWTLVSYAVSVAGAVVVPIYPTNSPSECKWVAGNSGARRSEERRVGKEVGREVAAQHVR